MLLISKTNYLYCIEAIRKLYDVTFNSNLIMDQAYARFSKKSVFMSEENPEFKDIFYMMFKFSVVV